RTRRESARRRGSRSCAPAPEARTSSWRRLDLGADSRIGEQLEQQRMRYPPVEDVRRAHAGVDRIQAGCELGAHAPGELRQLVLNAFGRGLSDQARGIFGISQPTGDVGEEDDLVRADRARDGAGGLV